MHRRFFLHVLLGVVLFLPGLLQSANQANASRPPNVIIVYTDDQGFGDASCLNRKAKFETPNIDRLADEGIVFSNGHSSDSVCTPSRYGLLTGRYAWRTPLKKGVMGAEGDCLISGDRRTIASMLGDNGYHTAMVGKWHLGMDFPGRDALSRDWSKPVLDMPLDKGFDYFFGVPASLNYGVLAWFEGRFAKTPPTLFTAKKPNQRHVDYRIMPPYESTAEETRRILGRKGMEVATDFVDNQCLSRFTEKAIDWMKSHVAQRGRDKPFFLYLPLTSPHYPVCPLPQFHGQGDCGGYGEFVIETDHRLGQILGFLDQSGIAEDTLLIFTSDNGPENSWRERISAFGHHSNLHYREGKRSIYEGGHRVPFLVRWPAGIKQPGRIYDGPVGQVDLMATLADIVGIKLEDRDAVDSQSFAEVMRDPNAKHQRLPLINHGAKGRFAITEGHWKLVLPHQRASAELYDLSADPGEATNQIDSHPAIAKDLQDKATRIVTRGRTTAGTVQANDTSHWADLKWISPSEYANLTISRD